MDTNRGTFLNMKDISIEFPGVKVLDKVNFSTNAGRVHAIVGANGAGKSTLMKILSGAYANYTGEIFIAGEKVHIGEPKDAKDLGIQIVYQEVDTSLISYLSVAENIMLDNIVNHMGKKQFVNFKNINDGAEKILKKLNIEIDTKKLISEITLAQKQMVLIARAISMKCRFLILDEPTAPLSTSEIKELFSIVDELKKQNVGIIFISHRLPELFSICDDVTVMRDGKFVVEKQIQATSQKEIVGYMLGRNFENSYKKKHIKPGKKLVEIKNLSDGEKVKDINIYAKSGEIVGIAGLVGAGKTELCNAIFGASKTVSGDKIIDGKKIKIKSPYDAVNAGIALIPEERRKQGVFIEESIAVNITSSSLNKFCKFRNVLNVENENKKAREIIEDLDIKTLDENKKVGLLSGGNQQKVAIGKWLVSDTKVYIFDEPTKGVDIGAKKEIFQLIEGLAEKGKSIIYASCEISELMGITDRIYIIYNGRIVKELNTAETKESDILY
ncbi:sugar ABC transporter ATP-binding protein [Clostridium coskatii]|uniref:Ribose import ATP-binding protein RbsA n=1 Tax=Clostridium coskatii TaxID=1705578 RepID=A0A166TL67_9CLOT|nr:sugar ABC transporter ATP-binding protein [Clostridium coskatii]OAA93828.1 Ribose import ATP-binding protein RbsA [Clostridium coskatii]OBR95156.1 ribose import ATP-binding protein RbsA [Clostridium coskatii]